MTITSVAGSTTSQLQHLQAAQRPARPAGQNQGENGLLQSVSSTLSMSASDIETQVNSGKSLLDLAESQGVSKADLLSAIKAGAPDDLKADATDSTWETLATQAGGSVQAARGVGGPGGAGGPGGQAGPGGGPGGGHGGPPPASGVKSGNMTDSQQSMLDSLASLLDEDSSDLLSSLQSGTDLSSLLSSKNVDSTSLAGVIEKGFMLDAQA